MAAVTLADDFFDDARFECAGALLGMEPDLVRMRVARIWAWQTDRHTADEPAYVVPEAVIIGRLGAAAPEALIQAELAERRPGGIYLRGAEGRIEWLAERRSRAAAGGRARAAGAARAGAGRFGAAASHAVAGAPAGEPLVSYPQPTQMGSSVSPASRQRKASVSPAEGQRLTSGSPAEGQHQDQDQDQDQRSEISHPARDPAVPTPRIPPAETSGTPPAGATLVQHALERLRTARRELDPAAPPLPVMGGYSEQEMLQRLRPHPPDQRRAVLDRVLSAAIQLAREAGSVDRLYMGGITTERAWEMLAARPAPRAGAPRRERAGPKRRGHTAADELADMVPEMLATTATPE